MVIRILSIIYNNYGICMRGNLENYLINIDEIFIQSIRQDPWNNIVGYISFRYLSIVR